MGHPLPSDFETRTNATFHALMWALARPGTVQTMPGPGLPPVVEALIDRECAVFAESPDIAARAQRAGAGLTMAEAADHVFAVADGLADIIRQVRTGSDLYPDDGATLVVPCALDDGPCVRLSGPGIDGSIEASLGLPPKVWSARGEVSRYPMGFEMFLIDGAQVLGIPRSTEVELL